MTTKCCSLCARQAEACWLRILLHVKCKGNRVTAGCQGLASTSVAQSVCSLSTFLDAVRQLQGARMRVHMRRKHRGNYVLDMSTR